MNDIQTLALDYAGKKTPEILFNASHG